MVDPLMEKLRPGRRARAQAQQSWWKPVERLLVLAVFAGGYFHFCTHAIWGLHVLFHPEAAGGLAKALAGPLRFVPLVGVVAGAAPFLFLAGIVVNSIVYCIPPLRRVSEKGADRHAELTIRNANRGLFKAVLWSALIAAPLIVLAAATPFHPH